MTTYPYWMAGAFIPILIWGVFAAIFTNDDDYYRNNHEDEE